MSGKWKYQVVSYGLAVAFTAIGTWLHVLIKPYLGDAVPYITFFPAVFLTALLARFGPTVLAVVLSGLAAAHWSIPPENSLLPADAAAWAGLALYALFGFIVAVISEGRHRKSEQVQRERERFLVTLASIGDGVIVTDEYAQVTFMNTVAEQLTGWTLDESRGRRVETVFPIVNEHTRQTTGNPVFDALRERRVVGLANHTLLIAKDGTELAVEDSAAPIREQNGRIVGVVLVFRNVTRQRAAQVERARLAALVDSSEDAIIGQAFDGVVTDWNSGAERLFGFSAEEVVGRSMFSTIVPSDRRDELLEALRRVQQGELVDEFESVRKSKDGRSIPVAIRISPIRDAAGTIVGASAIDRDVSQLKAAERRRNARLAVTHILAHERNIDKAIAEILDSVCTALQWDVGCFWRLQPDGNVLRCQQYWQQPSRNLEPFRTATLDLGFATGNSLPGRVWRGGQPIWSEDVVKDPNFVRAKQAQEVGLHGGFACPVAVDEEFLGVIECFSHEIKQPDDDLLEMMTTIGGQIGQFIERRQSEQKLRSSEQELSDFFENAAVGLHWVGPDGTVLRANQAELDLLGYESEEYVGRHIAAFHADEPVIQDILKRLSDGQELREYEARLRCKDGSIKHVLIDSNVRWEHGQFIHTRCFTRDVTERKRAEAALQDSEQRLRLALEAGRMGSWEWNLPTGQVIWSTTLEAIHGLAPGSFPGTFEAYQQDVHPDDRQMVADSIRRTVQQGRDHHLEYRIIWPDNSEHWVEGRGKLFRDASGEPVRLIGVCTEVTERKRLEEQLQQQVGELAEAEARVRSVVNNVNDGIITIDERGIVTSFNPAAERIFGYAAAEVVGENVRMLMPAPYHDEHDGYIENYLRTGEAKIIGIGREVTGQRQDGSTFPLDLSVSGYRIGRRQLFTGLVRDVTKRKRMEQSLKFLAEASKSLSSLIDYKSTLQRVAHLAVPGFADWCAVDLLDDDGVLERLAVSHVNPAKVRLAEELYHRYPPDPDAPHSPMHVVRTGESQLMAEIDDALLVEAARDEEHLRILRDLNLNSYICVPLKAKARTLGVISFVAAESGRIYGPEDLSMAEDLAHRAAIAIENAGLYQAVRDADRRKDEFLAMLAHELRNPLAPIRSGLDILMMDANSHQEIITLMREQVEHVVRLVDDLLDVSRIVRGKIELRKEPVDVATLVSRCVKAVQPQVEDHRQNLNISLPQEPAWINADPMRLVQVLENLLNNASKYTDDEGTIELTAECQDRHVVISVRDNGVGIEPHLLPHVFELFTQATRSLDRSQGGLGIGLTLVKRIVQMHAGTVTAHSEGTGRGSTFVVRLPVLVKPGKRSAAPPPQSSTSQRRRILVVDDNVSSAWLVSELLKKLGHQDVQTAHDGPTALAKTKETHPEIVFLDIGLPTMDGYEVGRAIREMPEFDDVLLVALTGYGQEEDRRKTREAGFDEHLVKPPSVEQFKQLMGHPKLSRGNADQASQPHPSPGESNS